MLMSCRLSVYLFSSLPVAGGSGPGAAFFHCCWVLRRGRSVPSRLKSPRQISLALQWELLLLLFGLDWTAGVPKQKRAGRKDHREEDHLPVPSEPTAVQAAGRRRGLQGTSSHGWRLVWELDQSVTEPLQDQSVSVVSKSSGRIVVWGFFWMFSPMGDGCRLVVAKLLWALEVGGTFGALSHCSSLGPVCGSGAA